MKNSNKKRGFTIVELIIVIAVIAILAAVLISTFSSLINKSLVAADESLVRNLNEALAMDVTNPHNTMTDALKATKENGFDVSKINARASTDGQKHEILWDSRNDCFVYKKGNDINYIPKSNTKGDATPVELWHIANDGTISDTYSNYLAAGTYATTLDIKTGLDVGEHKEVTEVNYTNTNGKQDVVIRTNSANTKLTVAVYETGTDSDTIRHYGLLGELVAVNAGMHSYHEYGTVAYAIVEKGKIVADSDSKIAVLYAKQNEVAVLSADNGMIESAYCVSENISTSNKQNGGNVELKYGTIGTETINDTYIENKGKEAKERAIDNEIVEADESGYWINCAAEKFAAGDGSESNPYQIKTARQLSLLAYNVNTNATSSEYSTKYYKLVADIDLSGKAWTPIGTTNGKTSIFFSGNFDGNGYSIKNLTNNGKSNEELGLFSDSLSSVKCMAATYGLFGFTQNATISNITIKAANIDGKDFFKEAGIIIGTATGSLVMTNCSVDNDSIIYGTSKIGGLVGFIDNYNENVGGAATISNCKFEGVVKSSVDRAGSIVGALMAYGDSSFELGHVYQFINCQTKGTIKAEGSSGYGVGLVGFVYQGISKLNESPNYNKVIVFDNCTNTASLIATEGKGKYIGKIAQGGVVVVRNTSETVVKGLVGQVNVGEFLFSINGTYYGIRGMVDETTTLENAESEEKEYCAIFSPYDYQNKIHAENRKLWKISSGSMEVNSSNEILLKANNVICILAKNDEGVKTSYLASLKLVDGYKAEWFTPEGSSAIGTYYYLKIVSAK